MGELVVGLLTWAVIIAMYWLPSIVALSRGAKHLAGVAIVNGTLGWTGLGWIGALTWAVSSDAAKVAGK